MLSAQWDSILNFLYYAGIALPILAFGILVFMITTPYNEFQLIKEGANSADPSKAAAAKAASHDLGGKIIGLALVLASAIYHSVGFMDLLIWGVLGIVFQIAVFYFFELVTPFRIVSEIPRGNVAVAIFTSRLSMATGLLMAALISY